ncbi:Os01g0515001 [Oryza sativa Japonica Group]|uniref:Os01g0515001 protein n=1 Tax=Oryza sativa subsp. japonica TaxID=39947 RepID=A0A0P0V391_ORYSJ|nr:Os01g0515001 [Oryza sativa Japonica Group]
MRTIRYFDGSNRSHHSIKQGNKAPCLPGDYVKRRTTNLADDSLWPVNTSPYAVHAQPLAPPRRRDGRRALGTAGGAAAARREQQQSGLLVRQLAAWRDG